MNLSLNEALRRVEAGLGASYPASFHAGAEDLVALAATSEFQRAFPATRLVLDVEEARSYRAFVGKHLIPFMYTAAEHPDIYAFESGAVGAEPTVVVWCVHTTVHGWPDFSRFMEWVRQLCGAEPSGPRASTSIR